MDNCIVRAQASGVLWEDLVVGGLEHCQVRVVPWLRRIEGTPNDGMDEHVAETCTNMDGKVFDTGVNSLPVHHLRE